MKIISILLCATLVIALAGCNRKPEPATVTTQPSTHGTTLETTLETTVPSYTDPSVVYHAPMAAVSTPAITESSKADDGTTLFTYTYQNMTLFLPEAPVADKIYVDYQNWLSKFHTSARTLHSDAVSAYTGQDGWEPYSLTVQYLPMRFDEVVLSCLVTESIYDGNIRGNSTNISVTYDLLTGQALGIRDILVADYSAENLVDLIVAGLSEYEKQEMLFPDYATLISDMFLSNRPVENWYFAQDGLCFFFNPYEIAPYSSGMLVSKIPYDTLGGLLKDGYFPGEAVSFIGTPKVVDFNTANTESITNFAELILDADSKESLLCAEGTLINVRIQTGFWNDGSKTFSPEDTIFAATAISAGDGVLVQSGSVDLLLTYESQGQVHQFLLLAQ